MANTPTNWKPLGGVNSLTFSQTMTAVRGVFEMEVDDEDLSYGPTFFLAIVACTLAAVDAIIVLALVRSAGIGPIYGLLNRYGLGCCDMPLEEEDNDLNPPPTYEP